MLLFLFLLFCIIVISPLPFDSCTQYLVQDSTLAALNSGLLGAQCSHSEIWSSV